MQAIVLLGIFESNDDRDRRGESERNAVFAGKVQIWSIDLKERVLLIGLVSSGRQNLNLYSLMRSRSDRLCIISVFVLAVSTRMSVVQAYGFTTLNAKPKFDYTTVFSPKLYQILYHWQSFQLIVPRTMTWVILAQVFYQCIIISVKNCYRLNANLKF